MFAMTNAKSRKIIIIGTGPAGLTAAIYAARANLSPLIFEGHEPGGQLTLTTLVENFPGFPEGVMGPDLMNNMREQAKHFGAEFIGQNIQKVDFKNHPFKVYASENEEYTCDAVIVSTGASAKFLGLPNEKQLIGKGVSTCATCDGFFFRNQIIHVVGGGDTAMEEANFLTRFASKVTIVHRKDSFRASKAMQQKIFNNPKIEVLWNHDVSEILHNEKGVNGIKVKDVVSGKVSERKTDGLFYGIGHTPNTGFLGGQLKLDSHGLIVTERDMTTSIPGVFACGDVQDAHFRQAITAAGTGCQAAMMAEKYLEKEHKA
jgi:thioredoxin reductase (NADPH)